MLYTSVSTKDFRQCMNDRSAPPLVFPADSCKSSTKTPVMPYTTTLVHTGNPRFKTSSAPPSRGAIIPPLRYQLGCIFSTNEMTIRTFAITQTQCHMLFPAPWSRIFQVSSWKVLVSCTHTRKLLGHTHIVQHT